jgi:hypothetical protein
VVAPPLGAWPSWAPGHTSDRSPVRSWVKYNYEGYEAKPAYPEYRGLMDAMEDLGRSRGCGRAHWETGGQSLERYGTTLALMLLPYWTDGCIASMEGLYFESAATTPFHFVNASELAKEPTNPQSYLPYQSPTPDLTKGVPHLQMMGVRYYMALTAEAKGQADAHTDLSLVTRSGPWNVYEVSGADLVTPLPFQPAVAKGAKDWLEVALPWYVEPSRHPVPLVTSGPDSWPRLQVKHRPTDDKTIGAGTIVEEPPRVPASSVRVTDVRAGVDRISFDVDRPGQPVLVKASFFPNWRASGARGPFRATPNLMVVVPTDRHVELRYGRSFADWAGWMLTLVGLVAVVVMARSGSIDYPEPPVPPTAEEPEPVPEEEPVPAAAPWGGPSP